MLWCHPENDDRMTPSHDNNVTMSPYFQCRTLSGPSSHIITMQIIDSLLKLQQIFYFPEE